MYVQCTKQHAKMFVEEHTTDWSTPADIPPARPPMMYDQIEHDG